MKIIPAIHPKIKPDLVSLHRGQPTTTSLLIAEAFGKKHKNVLQAIERLECSDRFTRLNFQPSEYWDTTGRTLPMLIVTEKGFSMLAMGFTGKRAAEWRERYIEAFDAMKTALLQRQSLEWQAARAAGKLVRRAETDSIQRFIDYARSQGSQNAERYYCVFSKLVNQALGLHPDGPRPIRDFLPPILAAKLAVIEAAVSEVITQGIAENLPYKAVYGAVKDRVLELTTAFTPSARLLAA